MHTLDRKGSRCPRTKLRFEYSIAFGSRFQSADVAIALEKAGAMIHVRDAAGRDVLDVALDSPEMTELRVCNITKQPTWIANEQVTQCVCCQNVFGIAVRKHHVDITGESFVTKARGIKFHCHNLESMTCLVFATRILRYYRGKMALVQASERQDGGN